jgi:hypothetical protein
MVLTCADHGMIAEHLHWSGWTATRAMATGTVTWRTYGGHWDSTTADVTLTDPVAEPGKNLFTRLDMHVTGPTPPRFMRNVTFNEAPMPKVPALPGASRPPTALPSQSFAAPSGTLGYAQIEGFWVDAGGPPGSDGSYTYPQVAAAITFCESSYEPGIIQPGEPYSTTGWGLWQITPGNSVAQYGTDYQILDPWNNAEAAVYKYDAAGGFSPWTTYVDGCYASHLQTTGADKLVADPGEYVQINSAPPGTPTSPSADPGSTYGPPLGVVENLLPYYIDQYGHDNPLVTENNPNDAYAFNYVDPPWGTFTSLHSGLCWNYVPDTGYVVLSSCVDTYFSHTDGNEMFYMVPCPHSSWCIENYSLGLGYELTSDDLSNNDGVPVFYTNTTPDADSEWQFHPGTG